MRNLTCSLRWTTPHCECRTTGFEDNFEWGVENDVQGEFSMIKHIVMWQLKEYAEGADKATNAAKMKSLLEACANIVPGMGAFEVALAQDGLEATYDVLLYSEFESVAALDAYQNHPQHVALKPFVGAVREARQCMDYEVN
jgi:hypothetical protein